MHSRTENIERATASQPQISVVANFFNMRREARRTLYSMTSEYQRDISASQFEVIAVDNGSTEPLDENSVRAFGENFQYAYYQTTSESPAATLNQAVGIASAPLILIVLDGARILSPGILAYTLKAAKAFQNPFIYTLAMHIGSELQNESMLQGYDQAVEDALLEKTPWKENGYELFRVSSVATSSGTGFFSALSESNCIGLYKSTFSDLGGFDERFESPGGGLVNLDFFNRIREQSDIESVMLLGEATFHQFHRGVATNVPKSEHPWSEFHKEYEAIRGRPFERVVKPTHYFGHLPPQCRHLAGD